MTVLAAVALAAALAQPGAAPLDVGRLVDASARSIVARSGPIRGKRIERFDTARGEAQAFETDFQQGAFRRLYVFLIRPKEPGAGPISLMLTRNLSIDRMAEAKGDPPPYFVDLYTCGRHATVSILPAKPSYEALKALVTETLEDPASAGSSDFQVTGVCGFGDYVLPGLGTSR